MKLDAACIALGLVLLTGATVNCEPDLIDPDNKPLVFPTSRITCGSKGCELGDGTCPPAGFDSVKDFDIEKYISAPWYIQQQMPLAYLPEERLFCVRARYEKKDENDLSKGIKVFNYANIGEVNGPTAGLAGTGFQAFFSQIEALIPDLDDLSKLKVGPGFLQRLLGRRLAEKFYGPYWVVAVGESEDPDLGYDWAIVSGGPPTKETENGCKTGRDFLPQFQVNGIGLFLFSRKPVDSDATQTMRKTAKALGYDLTVLKQVEQEGCKYEGAE